MSNNPWYVLPKLRLPIEFKDRAALARALPYGGPWLLLESGGVYRGEPGDDAPLYATGCASFTPEYLEGHFGVVPNPILIMAAGQTALLLSAVLSIGQSGVRYAAAFTKFHDIAMELVNVRAGELVAIRAWLPEEPSFEGPVGHPTVIRGTVRATVDVVQHGNGSAKLVRVLTVNGGLDFVARPKLGVFRKKRKARNAKP